MAFQHVPTLQSTGRLRLTPPSTWFSRMLACAYFSLTTIGPACPTTWRPPNRGAMVFCSRCALHAFWDLSPLLPAASLPFKLPNRGDIVPSGVFGVGLPSLCLSPPIPLAFFRSGDLTVAISYLLGSFSVYPPSYHRRFRLPPFIQAVESWLLCDSSCVCALLIPTKELAIW